MKSTVVAALALLATSCGDEPKTPTAPIATPTSAPEQPSEPAATTSWQIEITGPAEVAEGASFEVACTVRGSSDPNVRYSWSSSNTEPKLLIPRNYTPSLALIAPEATAHYDLHLSVRVGVGSESATKEVSIRVEADDDPPTAELIAPTSVECGEVVALAGQAHNEIHQGVTVEWRQIGEGPRVELEGGDRLHANFVAPEHAGPYEIALELHVRDGTHPDHVQVAKIAVDCDPSSSPLSPGDELTLASAAGVPSPLPRGHWTVEGTLELAPQDDATPGVALVRFDALVQAAALALATDGKEFTLSTRGFTRAKEGDPWVQPEWDGGLVLGPWPAGVPLGFVFESSGRDVSVRFGPAGAPEQWPDMPPILLPLGQRPRAIVVEVTAADAKLGPLKLVAK